MIFHDSHVISCLFFKKLGKMSQNLSSAAVVIGALRVKWFTRCARSHLIPLCM